MLDLRCRWYDWLPGRDNNMKKLLPVLVAVLAWSSAHAEVTVKDWRESKTNPETAKIIKTYIAGITSAYTSANGYLDATKREMLYCAPDTLAINVNNSESFLDSILEKRKGIEDTMPISIVILVALREAFPCK
jgi:hypothetical protein